MGERLRSDFWVSAYLRRCAAEGLAAVLRRRGGAEAGAIFVTVDRLDGTATLYGPAPQSDFEERAVDRRFSRAHAAATLPLPEVAARLAREARYDPDLWVVDVEDRAGRHFLDLAASDGAG